ncbi:MAG: bifunctional DNA-formamidopyrimidine glycosylase/DNA-(apurinic or apyrimidinic site) lyase [Proteobacteria bacterium]|nr:bifunctional DNA-formamidopyrimidine glycosylase/DNA-(apurinic or apyrimidinic site) lyase [Pseudomonadota bacterium]
MPELPEVETVRTGLARALEGATIAQVTLRRADLRQPFPPHLAAALRGSTISRVSRRAKYLLFSFDSDDVLIAHLGMTGRFSVQQGKPKLATHDHVVMGLTDGRSVIYNDARRFGVMTLAKADVLAQHPLLAVLGPEPLDKGFSAAYLKKALLARKTPVKVALMDQALVVGVGNIYASEALFLAGVDPRKPAHEAAPKAAELVAAIRQVLQAAIASGGSSLRDFLQVSGDSGYFQHQFNVYGRQGQPCVSCGRPLEITRQAGRSTFFCGSCQH